MAFEIVALGTNIGPHSHEFAFHELHVWMQQLFLPQQHDPIINFNLQNVEALQILPYQKHCILKYKNDNVGRVYNWCSPKLLEVVYMKKLFKKPSNVVIVPYKNHQQKHKPIIECICKRH